MVVGGLASPGTSEILSLETLQWREGPPVPGGVDQDPYVQIGPTFVVYKSDPEESYVLMFDEVDYCFAKVPVEANSPSFAHAIIPLPKDLGVCAGGQGIIAEFGRL